MSTLWARGTGEIMLSILCIGAYTSSSNPDIIPLQNPSTHELIIGRVSNELRPSYREAPNQVRASEQATMAATSTSLPLYR